MHIEEFKLERLQSLWENRVDFNLTESGIHPYTLKELLSADEIEALLDVRLGYGWTNGEPGLRRTVASYYPGASQDNVLITNGSAEANFLAMWTLLEPGDEIVMVLPNYMQIWGIARFLGVQIKPWRLREELGWAPDLEELESLLTPKARLVVICNPNNPTGAVLTRSEMERVVELASRSRATVYADEVYKGVELDGPEVPSFRDLDPNAIVASGLSKALAHPGLRIGWLVGSEEFIARAWHHNDYTTITTTRLSEFVAEVILQPDRRQQILQRNRQILRRNLQLLHSWIEGCQGAFSLVPPKAGGMAFLRCNFPVQTTEFCRRLRDEKSLLVLPGDVFGMDGYLRIGIGGESDALASGLQLLKEAAMACRTGSRPE